MDEQNFANEVAESQESASGEVQASENGVMGLSEIFETSEEETAESTTQPETQEAEASEAEETPKRSEGGIKGRLLESERRGYDSGKREAETSWSAEKQQMQADLDEARRQLNEYKVAERAAQIAKEEKCSMSMATRFARMELNAPAPQETKPQQNRDPQTGRFVSSETADVNDRAQFLFDQAQTIKRATGIDVLELFSSDKEVQRMVSSGEKDFADIAKEYGQKPQKRTPAPVRSSNDGRIVARSFKDMTDEQFDAMQEKLRQGYVVDLRR